VEIDRFDRRLASPSCVVVAACAADECGLAKDAGPCFDAVLRFYWSGVDAECRPFTYGGCAGNNNAFRTADQCYDRCAAAVWVLSLADA